MVGKPLHTVDVRIATRAWRGKEAVDVRPLRATAEYPFLEVAQPLPDLCAAHGRRAVERRGTWIRFLRTGRGSEQATSGSLARSFSGEMWRALRTLTATPKVEISAVVYGEWPVCGDCVRRAKRLRWLGHTLAAIGPAALVGSVVAFLLTGPGQVPILLVLAAFPGGFPLGVILAIFAYGDARALIHCRPIADETSVIIRAHPEFADAAQGVAGSAG
ncbi:hypothetical protein ACLMAL_06015 [Nocardia sp. CWNU-33]|uniref:hypothetical protein n=1 Tax=Nocardia sp. CWNU-33 TaxID=3392117 RepID=UPI00398E5AA5